jgi:glycosyltransferase involved in cell wall biosynthesis
VRILILHSRYLSGAASGENSVVEDETALLRAAGHEVDVWDPSPSADSSIAAARLGARAIWSSAAMARVRESIRHTRAEVVHLHNLFPMLSPAALRAVARERVPSVVTLHNYRLMCLPATLLRDQRVCEDCVHRRVAWPGVVHRCYRGSLPGSAALAASIGWHRAFGTFDLPALYLAVSEFVRSKYVEAGWPASKIRVKSNFAWEMARRDGPGEYFLYLGRLSREKGIAFLLEAVRELGAKLLVVGDGPDRSRLSAGAPAGVEFRDAVPHEDVPGLIKHARAVVLPSICYEGQPRVVLEAFAAGVPVIATGLGGLQEVVEDGESGLLVGAGDVGSLRNALQRVREDAEAQRLGDGARRRWQALYSPARALENLEASYRQALSGAAI